MNFKLRNDIIFSELNKYFFRFHCQYNYVYIQYIIDK